MPVASGLAQQEPPEDPAALGGPGGLSTHLSCSRESKRRERPGKSSSSRPFTSLKMGRGGGGEGGEGEERLSLVF